MKEEILLDVVGLKVYFYTRAGVVRAVDGVNFNVRQGETLGLIGESGSGKSVTCFSVLRIVPNPGKIVSGKILYKGEDLLEKEELEMLNIRGKEITMIFQDPATSLDPLFTIGDQLVEVIRFHRKVDKKEAEKLAIELLQAVGIPDAESKIRNYPWELSGGMRQRIAIARALACRPRLLLADEPTTNLDVTIQAQILDFLKELKEKFGMTLVLVSHDMGVIYEMADRVAVLYAGRACEIADRNIIFRESKHPYTEALITSVPRIGIRREGLKVIPGEVPDLVNSPSGCRFHPRCKYAESICKKEQPPLIDLGGGHLVACHLYK